MDIRQDLRERRTYLKASLEEVSRDLQISPENIKEIEDDRAYFNIMNAKEDAEKATKKAARHTEITNRS